MNDCVLQCRDLTKSFGTGALRVDVLRQLNLQVEAGTSVAIMGASGSGKSTLLHLLAGLDRADTGDVEMCGRQLETLGDLEMARLRNRHLGFVYQMHHLLPEFTARENVAMPGLIAGEAQAYEKAESLLAQVGLGKRLQHLPSELSGGERQRVAICRALLMNPDVVLADEPTGNLDPQSAREVFDLLLELNAQRQLALVLVTHNDQLAKEMGKGYRLREGQAIQEW